MFIPTVPTSAEKKDPIKKAPARGRASALFAEVKNKNTQQTLRREYACRGQMLESSSTEIIELYLRTGEKIIVLENSAVVVE